MNFKKLATMAALAACGLAATAGLTTGAALAQDAAPAGVSGETAFVFNTFSFLVNGALVMWMAVGFAMLESGLVRSKNTASICLKNIALYSLAGILYYLVGYNLMYVDVSGYIGSFGLLYNASGAELELLGGSEDPAVLAEVVDGGYSILSDWFFQMVFVATAASIVSGTVAERIKVWPFLIFVIALTAIIYPIQGSWTWGGGWLAEMGFSDFAGSTIVHSVGGWAALTGAVILGARKGKYGPDGRVNAMPGANLPLATLGTFILWLGWFGFNGGSVLKLGDIASANSVAMVFLNTNTAAAGGLVAALLLARVMFGKGDLTMALNGALAGLVVITAEPSTPTPLIATLFGAAGGILVVFSIVFFDKIKIDDPVGAISVHGVCGLLGLMVVPLTNGDATFSGQIIGAITIFVWVFVTSLIVWGILKAVVGIRVSEEEEVEGVDLGECGMEAYPEFTSGGSRRSMS